MSDVLKVINVDNSQCHVTSVQHVMNEYHVYLDENFIEPSYYRNVLDLLRDGSENDTFIFHLNTYGGRDDSGMALVRAIQNTSSDTIAVIERNCMSMGAVVAVSCNQLIVNKGANMMIHDIQFGTCGSGSNNKRYVDFIKSESDKEMEELFKEFLTEVEMKEVIYNSSDLYLNDEQIIERWNNKVEKMTEDVDKEEEDV